MTTLPQTSPMRLPKPNPSHLAIPSANGHAPLAAHAPSHSGLTGADAWRVIRANLWLIIGVLIASAVAGFFINMWLAAKYARYTSTALVGVQTGSQLPQVGGEHAVIIPEPSPQNVELEQQTQAASLTNRGFLSSILENELSPIRQTGWFQQFANRLPDAKEDLQDKLSVTPRQGTRYIEVSMSCASPRDAQIIVSELVNRHIEERRGNVQDYEQKRSQELNDFINRKLLEQDTSNKQLTNLQTDMAKVGWNPAGAWNPLDSEINGLIQREVDARSEWQKAVGEEQAFQRQIKLGLTPLQLQKALADQGIGSTSPDIQRLQSDLKALVEELGPNNPKVIALQKKLDEMQQEFDDTRAKARNEAIRVIEDDMQFKVQFTNDNFKKIEDALKDRRGIVTHLAGLEARYNQLQEQVKVTRGDLEKAQSARDQLQQLLLQNWGTAELAQAADLPDKPSFPRLPITMTLAIGLGLVLSLGIAFLREMLDTTVRSPRDIAKVGQLNLLGMIPHEADDPEAAGARLPLAIYEAPHSIIAEQFRQVRTRLQHSASLDTVRSLLVTGTSPGDGKTIVACNLAAGLALNGRRILLVDANFRRPQIHTVFNLPNETGFGDVLNSLDAFDDAVRDTDVPNLSVLTTGSKPSNSTELLESQLLIDFIERALEEFDHVIFDSGPLLLVSETAALAPRVDGVVTVVRARGNSRGLLQRLRDQLRQLKAEHLGVVLNAVRSQSGGYYAPMIKSYYAYQNG